MDKQGRHFMIGAVAIAAGIHVLSWLVQSCGQSLVVSAINAGNAASCSEFWLNRYQTLTGVVVALLVAAIAVRPVWRQVNLMAAQSAMQMAPRVKAEIDDLKKDYIIVGKLIDVMLSYDSLVENSGHTEPNVPFLLTHLRTIRGQCSLVTDHDWEHFCSRPDLDEETRSFRNEIKEEIDQAFEEAGRALNFAPGHEANFLVRTVEHSEHWANELTTSVTALQFDLADYRVALLARYDSLRHVISSAI